MRSPVTNISDEANKLRVDIVRCGTAHGRRYPEGLREPILEFNASERPRRRVALGRKNYPFVGDVEAGASIAGSTRSSRPNHEPARIRGPERVSIEGVTVARASELMRALA
jgi:hypothetical protein